MPYFETKDGAQLFYRAWGTGKPLLFISGWALSSKQWQHQMYHFSQHNYRCIAFDRRGHGRSDDAGGGYDYSTLASDLASLITQLELQEVTLIAHSFGCGEIVRYLSIYGTARITRVVFIAPMLPFPMQTEDNPAGIPVDILEGVRANFELDFPQWLKENEGPYLAAGLPGERDLSAIGAWTIQDMYQTTLQAIIESNHTVCETDFREELRHIKLPALIIQGDCDASIPIEISGVKTAQLIQGSKLIVYENAPHGLYLTHREQLIKDLSYFLS